MALSNLKAKEPLQKGSGSRLEVVEKKRYLILKRFLDIVLSIVGLIILSPLFVIITVIIKVEDHKGYVFFSQTRIGKNGKPFTMYKFRSMVSNAEDLLEGLLDQNETTGAMFKMKHDPRVTKVGRFIRKTSFDELPQLFNVLKGDMSLVGPRPPLEREVKEYTPYQKQRLRVKPGCTGLWQVSGRSNIGFEDMVELDITYVSQRNTKLDFIIIFKTILLVFKKDGAY